MDPIPDEVEGGVIMRDSSGKATGGHKLLSLRSCIPDTFYTLLGVLLDNAQELANSHRPEPTYEQLAMRFNLTVQDAVSFGLTSIHDAGFDPRSLQFFRRSVILNNDKTCLWRTNIMINLLPSYISRHAVEKGLPVRQHLADVNCV